MRSEAERTGLLRKAFQVCSPMNAMPPNAGMHLGYLGTFSAAGRWAPGLHGSAYRPLFRMGELTQMCQLIPKRLFF